jgi:SAM-dependent methyltransferase
MTNKRMQDPDHLRSVAYSDAAKLNARIKFWQHYGEPRNIAFKRYFDRFQAPSTANVLDLGCGPAHFWQWGLENDRVPQKWTITLTDLSPGMIDEARRNVSGFDREFTFDTADVCDLQFDDASFDMVTANYMLYHARSQSQALAEISRVLKPGGRLYAATNSINHITEFLDLQEKFAIDDSQQENVGLAHAAFTLENGEAMIEEHFSSVDIVWDNSICEATDPQIVIDFAMSMDAIIDEPSLEEAVKAEIASKGHFAVTRSSGVFIAQK